MSHPVVISPLSRFGSKQCVSLREQFWIHKRDLCARAGVSVIGFERFEKGHPPPGWKGKAAIYDALLDMIEERARWIVGEIEKARKVHHGQ